VEVFLELVVLSGDDLVACGDVRKAWNFSFLHVTVGVVLYLVELFM
jgi:hypothetical protein